MADGGDTRHRGFLHIAKTDFAFCRKPTLRSMPLFDVKTSKNPANSRLSLITAPNGILA